MISCDRPLEGKRILFLSWAFYQYPSEIKNEIENLGGMVDYYCSAPTDDFMKMKYFSLNKYRKSKYFNSILSSLDGKTYDYILMINAAAFPFWFSEALSKKYENSIKLLYSWDSINVFPQIIKTSKLFDKTFSFDLSDCERHDELNFLPLFYCRNFEKLKDIRPSKDFSFVGFGHSERYSFIKKIEEYSKENGYTYSFYLYLPSALHFLRGKYITKLFPDAKKNDFIYKTVSYEKTCKNMADSRVVLDLELSSQTGLTMRTIETLGMGRKLITTNANIKKYDFYDERNILIVNRQNPEIPKDFMQEEYHELEDSVYKSYSLQSWVRNIFSV